MEFALGSVFKLKYIIRFQIDDDLGATIGAGTRCYVANNENTISLVTLDGSLQCIDINDAEAARDIFEPSDELEFTELLCDWDIKKLDLDAFSSCDASIKLYNKDQLVCSVVIPKRIPDTVYFRFTQPDLKLKFDNLVDHTAHQLYELVTGSKNPMYVPSSELKRLLKISIIQYIAARMNKGAVTFLNYLKELDEIYPSIIEATVTPATYYAS